MPSVEVKIWMALRNRINTLPLVSEFDIAWPARTHDPVNIPYLRIGHVTTPPVGPLVKQGTPSVRTGTLIVTLVMRLEYDIAYHEEQAAQVSNHFQDGTLMNFEGVCVRVTAQPHVQPGYEDNGYWTIPVTIPWRTFA